MVHLAPSFPAAASERETHEQVASQVRIHVFRWHPIHIYIYGPALHTWDANLMVQEGCNTACVASGGSDVQRGGAA